MDSVTPTQAIIEAVAAAACVDETDLDPLYEAIDPDALNALVEASGGERSEVRIQFRFNGYVVTVADTGVIQLQEVGDES
ncbi:HalOD1 output domain-containing protein [Natronomonas sp.]|uniref:HalOD1 output domain-containing protein n=1 Tax=Natronomonas sp. TaxID=2184060 RepID=UPI003976518A